MSKTYTVVVDWDTDGEKIDDLPDQFIIPSHIKPEDLADMLSDEYGWCVNSIEIVEETK